MQCVPIIYKNLRQHDQFTIPFTAETSRSLWYKNEKYWRVSKTEKSGNISKFLYNIEYSEIIVIKVLGNKVINFIWKLFYIQQSEDLTYEENEEESMLLSVPSTSSVSCERMNSPKLCKQPKLEDAFLKQKSFLGM